MLRKGSGWLEDDHLKDGFWMAASAIWTMLDGTLAAMPISERKSDVSFLMSCPLHDRRHAALVESRWLISASKQLAIPVVPLA